MIHPFSLMNRDSHPESIYDLLELKVDRTLIATVVEECIETVDYALGLPTTSRRHPSTHTLHDKEFAAFVGRVLRTAEVTTTDALVTMIYLRRARAHLSVDAEKWVLHRVFLGALVLAHKYSNDSTLRNVSWSYATGAFGMRDIGRMEREFLDVLDYELSVSEADLLDLHETIIGSHSSQPAPQLYHYFHSSPLERVSRPEGVELFRTPRVSDETSDDGERAPGSLSSVSLYEDEEAPFFPLVDQVDSVTHVETESSVPSLETPSTSQSSSEPSATMTSPFSYQPHMVTKPFASQDGAQKSAISRALWLAGHQLISSLPTAFSQVAVSS